MTQDEIIEMARQTLSMSYQYGSEWEANTEDLEAFAKLVDAKATAKEREACAKICDNNQYVHPFHDLGTLIRARGETWE